MATVSNADVMSDSMIFLPTFLRERWVRDSKIEGFLVRGDEFEKLYFTMLRTEADIGILSYYIL